MSTVLTSRLRRGTTTLAVLALAGLSALIPTAHAQAAPAGLELVAVRHSLLGTHYWYRQTSNGHPVVGGYYAEHVDARTGARVVDDGRIAVGALKRTSPTVNKDAAVAAAAKRTPGSVIQTDLVVRPGAAPTLAWSITSTAVGGSTRTLVDAGSGAVLKVESLVKHADGQGAVFVPNPVVALQNQGLKDNSPASAFQPAYKQVTLTQLSAGNLLRGAYAYNANPSSQQASSPTRVYNYNRNQAGFEQAMAYYSMTHAQEYIHSLGFTNVNSEPQKFATYGYADDNSYYDPAADKLTFGTGGVDDAEDPEVIWHEYGHAIQDAQVPGFGSGAESGAIGEGFGDYWAYTMSSETSKDSATTPLTCIADWDSISYASGTPHCLRRVDGNKIYPRDTDGEVHDDGEIWSRALADVFKALGREKADKTILEAQFSYAPNTSFKAAAEKTVAAAQKLFGAAAAASTRAAFHARGIV